jgi:hypothetical protein
MRRFKLCFAVDEHRILVPDLLPIQEPRFEVSDKGALRYEMEYEFLPKAVMPRVIVNLNGDIKQALVWRTGVVLENRVFESTAVIRADVREMKLSVWVSGRDRLAYFSIIRKVLLDIASSFEGLGFKEKVPCACGECKDNSKPYFFAYDYLIKRKRAGKATVDCQRSVEEVSIDLLLSGIELQAGRESESWDVFVSYSSRDLERIDDLVRKFTSRHVRCWWDYEQIQPGDSISQKIELGLRKSRFIVPCLSRNQVLSGCCRAEYGGILGRVLSGQTAQRVVPVIVDDLPDDEVPVLLRDFRCERLTDPRGYDRLVSVVAGR